MAHVFISYMREDQAIIDRLIKALTKNGVRVWLDRNDLEPGVRWRTVINTAINEGSYFLACFSTTRTGTEESYANTEMNLALEKFRKGENERSWFIPIKLDSQTIPKIPIQGTETLLDLQYIDLSFNWKANLEQLLSVLYLPEFELQKKIFTKLEMLIAIYSLVYWRSPKQLPPEIMRDSEWENNSFTLSCDDINWGSDVPGEPGELFSCFSEIVTQYSNYEREPFEGYYVTPNEDYWYTFAWQSLFRYQLDVELNPSPKSAYGGYYSLQNALENETSMTGDPEGYPLPITGYVVQINGLRYAKSTGFLVGDGYMLSSVDGYNHKRDEWVIYHTKDLWYKEQDLRKAIDFALEWKKIQKPTLEMGVRVLENEWKGRYPYFNELFLKELGIDLFQFD